jgi:hypothetical protein
MIRNNVIDETGRGRKMKRRPNTNAARRAATIAGTWAAMLSASAALAHPGHGEPGWWHLHGDMLLDGGLILLGIAGVGGLVVLIRRRGKARS